LGFESRNIDLEFQTWKIRWNTLSVERFTLCLTPGTLDPADQTSGIKYPTKAGKSTQ